MSRYGTSIYLSDEVYGDNTKKSSIEDEFAANLEKISVQSVNNKSTFDAINQILGNKSKYSTVDEAVLDMQKRTGLFDYLQNKKASTEENPAIFAEIPEMKTFIDNYVQDRPGTSIEAVVHDLVRVSSIKSKLGKDDVDESVRRYINKQISKVKSEHTSPDELNLDLGKVDTSNVEDRGNTDPLAICEPVKF